MCLESRMTRCSYWEMEAEDESSTSSSTDGGTAHVTSLKLSLQERLNVVSAEYPDRKAPVEGAVRENDSAVRRLWRLLH